MINQKRKDFLIRKNKGTQILDKYLSGISKASKRIVSRADLIPLEETDTLLKKDFTKSVLKCSSVEKIFSEQESSSLFKTLKDIGNVIESPMCYLHLSHFGDTCGLLYLPTDVIIENLVHIVKFDGDDAYIYDLDGGNALHLEYLTDTFIESLKIYGNAFELRLYGRCSK